MCLRLFEYDLKRSYWFFNLAISSYFMCSISSSYWFLMISSLYFSSNSAK